LSTLFDGNHLRCVYFPKATENIISIKQLHDVGFGVFSFYSYMILLKLQLIPKQLVRDMLKHISYQLNLKKNGAIALPYKVDGDEPIVHFKNNEIVEPIELARF
jgi:hypothetical protein